MEQRGAVAAIQALQERSNEELETETRHKAAAMAILGARASERFEPEEARAYFQRAIAAARPQERMQIRRMADASLALAERRAGDLKQAVERLGQAPPTGRQMFALRAMGLLLPASSAGMLARVRGILLLVLLIAAALGLGLGIVLLIALPFGGIGIAPGILLGVFLVAAVIAVLVIVGRRKRDRARAAASEPGS
jgi:tetratricopeptide (TPR) repeat protein